MDYQSTKRLMGVFISHAGPNHHLWLRHEWLDPPSAEWGRLFDPCFHSTYSANPILNHRALNGGIYCIYGPASFNMDPRSAKQGYLFHMWVHNLWLRHEWINLPSAGWERLDPQNAEQGYLFHMRTLTVIFSEVMNLWIRQALNGGMYLTRNSIGCIPQSLF